MSELSERDVERLAEVLYGEFPPGRGAPAHVIHELAEVVATIRDEAVAPIRVLAEEWAEWSRFRSTPRINAFRDAADCLRALLDGGDQS